MMRHHRRTLRRAFIALSLYLVFRILSSMDVYTLVSHFSADVHNARAAFHALRRPERIGAGYYECTPETDRLFVMVRSAAADADKRNLMRNTWATPRLRGVTGARTVFLLSGATDDDWLEQIQWEQDLHGDLVLGGAGVNETWDLHEMTWVKWASRHCPFIPYVLVVQDGLAVDLMEALNVIKEEERMQNFNGTLLCSGDSSSNDCDGQVYFMNWFTREAVYETFICQNFWWVGPDIFHEKILPDSRTTLQVSDWLKPGSNFIQEASSKEAINNFWKDLSRKSRKTLFPRRLEYLPSTTI